MVCDSNRLLFSFGEGIDLKATGLIGGTKAISDRDEAIVAWSLYREPG